MAFRRRPWDRRPLWAQTQDIANKRPRKEESTQVPFVTVDGVRYYSDRFYLNATTTTSSDQSPSTCHCGSLQPPPTLDKRRLIASLDLSACILSTYNLDKEWILDAFPTLFGPSATIPTLVVYGKGGKAAEVSGSGEESDGDDTVDEEVDHVQECWENDNCQTPGRTDAAPLSNNTVIFPETALFTQILPTWIPPHLMPDKILQDSSKGASVSKQVAKLRKFQRGVHHPKYMILLETSGSLIVVVSTDNLTPPNSVDGTWVQRFTPNKTRHVPSTKTSNPFGRVLADFILKQSLASAIGHVTPLGFLQRHFGCRQLHDLEKRFEFDQAQVALIATVPGVFPILDNPHPTDVSCQNVPPYGRYGVAAALDRYHKVGWLPLQAFSNHDRLLLQPTSIGSAWKSRNMLHVVESYWNHPSRDIGSSCNESSLLEQVDIIWPTEQFVKAGVESVHHEATHSSANYASGHSNHNRSGQDPLPSTPPQRQGYLFLSTSTFNGVDLACLSRLTKYTPSTHLQAQASRSASKALPPHFKSITRTYEGPSEGRWAQEMGFHRCRNVLPWFLMTSACLSRGAQGDLVPRHGGQEQGSSLVRPVQDAVSYSNFELGVLFCSRLSGQHCRQHGVDQRLYCFQPKQCSCASSGTNGTASQEDGPRLIHLPVPFRLDCLTKYEAESGHFTERPYFHEVVPGTVNCGNMRLIPDK